MHKMPWLVVFAGLASACVGAPTTHRMHVDAGLGLPDAGQGPLKPADAPLQQAAGRAGSVGRAGSAGLAAPQPSDAGVRASAAGAPALPRAGSGGVAPPLAAAPPALPQPGVGQLVITELMIDPKTLTDDEGEWIELANTTQTTFDLMGCSLDDGSKALHSLMTSMLVPPLAYVTIARNAEPGFMPDHTESLSLTNSADSVALRCGDHEIDRVAYDKSAGFPMVSGASLALDPARLDAMANDNATAWCSGRDSYGPELGSPGQPNPRCGGEEQGEDAGIAAAVQRSKAAPTLDHGHGLHRHRPRSTRKGALMTDDKPPPFDPDASVDIRDGLTRVERVVLHVLREAQAEFPGRRVPAALLYGRVVEYVNIGQAEFQRVLARLAGA